MKLNFARISSTLLALLGMTLPAMLRADCLPSAPNGYYVPYSLVTLKNYTSGNQFASYSTGTLQASSHSVGFFEFVETLSSTRNQQLFSDRFDTKGCDGIICTYQPFAVDRADQLGVSISRTTLLGHPGAINGTFTLESWGNATESFTGTCDATTGSLTGTLNGNTFVVVTFGTPYSNIIQ
ncbi:MAG: hypothetical protein JO061_12735 [Acidobacteriaceae bacterium]|nr:hypothetical protein [Acidobacteriaceae bacterium]